MYSRQYTVISTLLMLTSLLFFFKGVNNNDIDSSKRPDPAPLHWPNSALESATLDQISSPALKPFTNTQ